MNEKHILLANLGEKLATLEILLQECVDDEDWEEQPLEWREGVTNWLKEYHIWQKRRLM